MIFNPVVSHGGSDWEEVENFAQIVDADHYPNVEYDMPVPIYLGEIQWLMNDEYGWSIWGVIPVILPGGTRPYNDGDTVVWNGTGPWVNSLYQHMSASEGSDGGNAILEAEGDSMVFNTYYYGAIQSMGPSVQLSTGEVNWGDLADMAAQGKAKIRYLKYNGPEAFRSW